MSKQKNSGIGLFEKYLTLWVVICMVVGVLIGKFLPAIPDFLSQFEYAQVSIPIAILIWLMIYPMMLKVDFASIKTGNPKGLFVTYELADQAFTMLESPGFSSMCFSKHLSPISLLAGTLLALRPTAMVFVWSHLTNGSPAYTVVQVATNLIILSPLHHRRLFWRRHRHPVDTHPVFVVLFVVISLSPGL